MHNNDPREWALARSPNPPPSAWAVQVQQALAQASPAIVAEVQP